MGISAAWFVSSSTTLNVSLGRPSPMAPPSITPLFDSTLAPRWSSSALRFHPSHGFCGVDLATCATSMACRFASFILTCLIVLCVPAVCACASTLLSVRAHLMPLCLQLIDASAMTISKALGCTINCGLILDAADCFGEHMFLEGISRTCCSCLCMHVQTHCPSRRLLEASYDSNACSLPGSLLAHSAS